MAHKPIERKLSENITWFLWLNMYVCVYMYVCSLVGMYIKPMSIFRNAEQQNIDF